MNSSCKKKLSASLLGILLCAGAAFPAAAAVSDIASGSTKNVTGGDVYDYLKSLGIVKATGTGAIAEGVGAIASRQNSAAYGNSAKATADSATAIGYQATASGTGSLAVGKWSNASAKYSSAYGYKAQALYEEALAVGYNALASGKYSSTFGVDSSAMGWQSIAAGYRAKTLGDNSIASGTYATALGANSTALGLYSVAVGGWSSAFGYGSFAADKNEISFGHSKGDYYYNYTNTPVYKTAKNYTPKITDSAGNEVTDSYGKTVSFSSTWLTDLVVPDGKSYNVTYKDGSTKTLKAHDILSYEKNEDGTGSFTVREAQTWSDNRNVRLTHVATPTKSTDAANKNYVDTVTVLYDKGKDSEGKDTSKVSYDTVTFRGTNGTQLKNVAEGKDGTDAVNVNQLNAAMKNFTDSQKTVEVAAGDHVSVKSAAESGKTVYTVSVSADGTVSKGNTGIVTGGTVYEAIQNISSAAAEGLKNKADADGANVTNASQWAEKLGTGKIEADNKELVTGGTVHEYINRTSLLKSDGASISVAPADTAEKVDFSHTGTSGEKESRVLTGVSTDAGDASSAANVGYVENALDRLSGNLGGQLSRLDDRTRKAIAGAAALAALHPLDYDPENKLDFAAAVGSYRGSSATAVGAFYRPNELLMFSVGGAFGNGENMWNAGVSVKVGHGSAGGTATKAELLKRIEKQEAENQEIKAENREMKAQIAELTAAVASLMERKSAVSAE